MNEEVIDYGEVMHTYYAGLQYGVRGPNYEDITWLESTPQPSKEHLAELWQEIKEKVSLQKVYNARALPGNYPSKEELIIALWDKIMENKNDYADELQSRRLEIKDQFPKPE